MSFQQRKMQQSGLAHQMVSQVNLPDYVATKNPQAANQFLVQKGMQPSTNAYELGGRIAMYINKNGEQGLAEIMQLHPDREEILKTASYGNSGGFHNATGNFNGFHNCSGGCGGAQAAPAFSNCSGCGGKCGGYSNATGSGAAPGATEKTLDRIALVALLAIVALAVLKR